jgi:hypothetical protein
MAEPKKSTVTPLPIRRRDDVPVPPLGTHPARRSSPAFGTPALPADLPINLPMYNETPAGIARRARLIEANKTHNATLERKLQEFKQHQADVRVARAEGYAKGNARGRVLGLLSGMLVGAVITATSMALGILSHS